MPGEEGPGETRQVGDDMVASVGPPAGEFEAVGALLRATCCGTAFHFMDVLEARGVAVVLGVRAVRDDEDLGVLIESRSGPEAVALVTVDLVERLLDRHAPSLQLDLHQRQAVDQNRHIIPGRVAAALLLELVKHLEAVAVNMHLVDETNVLRRAIVTVQDLDVVFLDQPGLVLDARRRRGDDLVEEMIAGARRMSEDKINKLTNLSEEEATEIARIVGLGALKYFILKVDARKNMLFNPAESIDFNGNTGPFIQYTYARIRSILRKAAEAGITIPDTFTAQAELSEKEIGLIQMMAEFPAVVKQAGTDYNPSCIANYCYDLVKEYNQFYHDFSILREEDENKKTFRLMLSAEVSKIIHIGMGLLGIEVPERM